MTKRGSNLEGPICAMCNKSFEVWVGWLRTSKLGDVKSFIDSRWFFFLLGKQNIREYFFPNTTVGIAKFLISSSRRNTESNESTCFGLQKPRTFFYFIFFL